MGEARDNSQKRLREAQMKTAERLRAYDALPELTGPACPGDVYIIPDMKTGVNVMVSHAGEHNNLFVVPADWIEVGLRGCTDLQVPEEYWGGEALVLRCGIGTWIDRDTLEKQKRAKIRIPNHIVTEVRRIIVGMIKGDFTVAKGPDEDDPELHEWCEEIEHDMDNTVARLDGNRP